MTTFLIVIIIIVFIYLYIGLTNQKEESERNKRAKEQYEIIQREKEREFRTCSNCRKQSGFSFVREELVSKEPFHFVYLESPKKGPPYIKRDPSDISASDYDHVEVEVNGVRATYRKYYKCIECGFEKFVERTEEE